MSVGKRNGKHNVQTMEQQQKLTSGMNRNQSTTLRPINAATHIQMVRQIKKPCTSANRHLRLFAAA